MSILERRREFHEGRASGCHRAGSRGTQEGRGSHSAPSPSQACIDGDEVSRIHAVIEVNSANDVEVIDLGSAAGTRINGAVIRKQKLRSGDRIQLGNTSLHVTIAAAASAR